MLIMLPPHRTACDGCGWSTKPEDLHVITTWRWQQRVFETVSYCWRCQRHQHGPTEGKQES